MTLIESMDLSVGMWYLQDDPTYPIMKILHVKPIPSTDQWNCMPKFFPDQLWVFEWIKLTTLEINRNQILTVIICSTIADIVWLSTFFWWCCSLMNFNIWYLTCLDNFHKKEMILVSDQWICNFGEYYRKRFWL